MDDTTFTADVGVATLEYVNGAEVWTALITDEDTGRACGHARVKFDRTTHKYVRLGSGVDSWICDNLQRYLKWTMSIEENASYLQLLNRIEAAANTAIDTLLADELN
jgi:hypothetical protein